MNFRLFFIALMVSLIVTGCDSPTSIERSTGPSRKIPPSEKLIERSQTTKSFDDVIFELDFAITERNYRITGRNTIGKGLRDRGYENFPNVEVIHFCNLEYAREVLLLDPGFVAQMPCRITIHEANNHTVISLLLLPEDHPNPAVNEFSNTMNGILREIVRFVVDPDQ